MSSPRRFPAPWSAELQPNYYVVRDANKQQLAYVYFENEPGRRSAAKLLRRDKALLSGGNIRSVLMREHALTGRHVQQLRQIRIVRAADFFIDDTGQLHRNRDQRTHMKHFALW